MSFTIIPGESGKVTFHVLYEGDAIPKDLTIYLLDPQNPDLDHAKSLTGYPQIPPGLDPNTGIDIDYFPGSPQFPTVDGSLAQGIYTFLLVWSFGSEKPNETDSDKPSILGQPPKPKPAKPWSWLDLWGKIFSGAGGSAFSSLLLNWWTVVALIPCIITGAIGGAAGGIAGSIFSWLFDAPKIKWNFRSSLLFGLFFTLAFSMLFGVMAVNLEVQAETLDVTFNRVTLGVSFVSAFLASILSGVLNNLRDEI